MRNVFQTVLIFYCCFCTLTAMSQDSLILNNGRRIAFIKMDKFADAIELKTPDKKSISISPDSIFGMSEVMKEQAYFLMHNPEDDGDRKYFFMKRIEVGKISLYEKSARGYAMYIEKGNQFVKIFDPVERGEVRDKRLKLLVSFLEDDPESITYIKAGFSFKFKEILRVIQYYNLRNFEEQNPKKNDVRGTVYLYRTKFQKTKEGIKVQFYDTVSDLYIEDFIQLNLPVKYPSKLTFYDSVVKTDIVLCGEFEDQFYEVLYDKRSNEFRIDSKQGSELMFEFYKIKDIVDKRFED